jgi:hypothetical protein
LQVANTTQRSLCENCMEITAPSGRSPRAIARILKQAVRHAD